MNVSRKTLSTVTIPKREFQAKVQVVALCDFLGSAKKPRSATSRGIYDCEGTRVLIHECLRKSVVNSLSWNAKILDRCSEIIYEAAAVSRPPFDANISKRALDFEILKGAGVFARQEQQPSPKIVLTRFWLLVQNLANEITREVTDLKFERYGLEELSLLVFATKKAWLDVNGKFETAQLLSAQAVETISDCFDELETKLEEISKARLHSATLPVLQAISDLLKASIDKSSIPMPMRHFLRLAGENSMRRVSGAGYTFSTSLSEMGARKSLTIVGGDSSLDDDMFREERSGTVEDFLDSSCLQEKFGGMYVARLEKIKNDEMYSMVVCADPNYSELLTKVGRVEDEIRERLSFCFVPSLKSIPRIFGTQFVPGTTSPNVSKQ